jgi:hypothetical protein
MKKLSHLLIYSTVNTFSPQTPKPNIQRPNPNRMDGHWKGPISAEKHSASRHLTESGILPLQLPTAGKTSFILEIIFYGYHQLIFYQGVTKRCRLSWLTNSALVYEPKCWGRGWWGLMGLSQWLQLCTWSPNKLWISNSYVFCVCLTSTAYPPPWGTGRCRFSQVNIGCSFSPFTSPCKISVAQLPWSK